MFIYLWVLHHLKTLFIIPDIGGDIMDGTTPWYGYGGYAYSYTTGSLFVTMIDLNKFDEVNKLSGAVWAGAINGLLEDTRCKYIDKSNKQYR